MSEQKQTSSTLVSLCILTLLGSASILLKGLIGYFILVESNDTRSEDGILFIDLVYFIEFLSCIGAIAGAILMLIGKKTGLLIYVISSILYILLTAAFAVFCFFSIIYFICGNIQKKYIE
jgi:hypothetical protein